MNLAEEIQAYATYVNGERTARENMDDDEFELFEQDKAKAEARMLDAYYGVRDG